MEGIIVKIVSNQYTVLCSKEKYICKARGKLRLLNDSPVVGDKVLIDIDNNLITEILPRENKLNRPLVANIEYAIITTSLKDPEIDLYLLDKMLTIIYYHKVIPIILFTKIDLCNDLTNINKINNYYRNLGIITLYNNDNKELANLKKLLKGKIVTLTGQSGAGKSSFLNSLNPNLNLKTSPISEALNRGVHTTRHVEIYDIEGIYFIDTPGFSAVDLNMTISDLKDTFKEFKNINCKYQDCNHDKEDDCKIKQLVNEKIILESRYNNYLLFKKEIYESSRKFFR